jgi:hypothetical protein
MSGLQLALVVTVSGGRYSQILQVISFLLSVIPGKRTSHGAQSTLCEATRELAMECGPERRVILAPGSVNGMDGSWSQLRNASHCAVAFLDVLLGKPVDFGILENQSATLDRHFPHCSNVIAVEAGRRVIEGWGEDQNLNAKGLGSVHDRDMKTRKLFRKLWPGQQTLINPSHITKSFGAKLNNNYILNGIKEKLRQWIAFRVTVHSAQIPTCPDW